MRHISLNGAVDTFLRSLDDEAARALARLKRQWLPDYELDNQAGCARVLLLDCAHHVLLDGFEWISTEELVHRVILRAWFRLKQQYRLRRAS